MNSLQFIFPKHKEGNMEIGDVGIDCIADKFDHAADKFDRSKEVEAAMEKSEQVSRVIFSVRHDATPRWKSSVQVMK
jgi:hypothetical protein